MDAQPECDWCSQCDAGECEETYADQGVARQRSSSHSTDASCSRNAVRYSCQPIRSSPPNQPKQTHNDSSSEPQIAPVQPDGNSQPAFPAAQSPVAAHQKPASPVHDRARVAGGLHQMVSV